MSQSVRTVMVGDIKFHLPFVDLIPFDAEQDKQLGQAIEEEGEILESVICWKEQSNKTSLVVVDGAHRVVHAARLQLDKVPTKLRSYGSEDEAKSDCEQRNLARRHLTEQQREHARRERVQRIAKLATEGLSQRQIAEKEDISKGQVQRDLEAASGPPRSKNERKGEKVCKRCKRMGSPVKDCPGCLRVRRETTAKAAKTRAKKAAEQAAGVVDAFGNPIPSKRLTDWQDPWIQDTFDFLTTHAEQFRDERLVSRIEKRAKKYPWFDSADFAAGVGFINQYFDELIEHIKIYRPAGVCPACDGAGCDKCRSSGFVPRETYEDMKK